MSRSAATELVVRVNSVRFSRCLTPCAIGSQFHSTGAGAAEAVKADAKARDLNYTDLTSGCDGIPWRKLRRAETDDECRKLMAEVTGGNEDDEATSDVFAECMGVDEPQESLPPWESAAGARGRAAGAAAGAIALWLLL